MMENGVPISVVIPAYNTKDFVAAAIESVHAQTISVAEIIVVDDGSSDCTAEVADRLGAKVIRLANRGASAARNAGVRAASSEWVALLDSDDIWSSSKIEYQWEAVRRHADVGIVSCRMDWFEADHVADCSTAINVEPNLKGVDQPTITYFPQPHDELPFDRTIDSPSSILVRRDLLLSVGLFDETLQHNEDLELFLRIIARTALAVIEGPLVHNRIRARSLSSDFTNSALSFIEVVDKMVADADKYPPRAAERYRHDVLRLLFPLGRSLMDEGQRRAARDLFARSLRMKYSHRALLFWSLTFLSPETFRRLVKAKLKLTSVKQHHPLPDLKSVARV